MKNFIVSLLKNLKIAFLHMFGRIRVYKWPMFVVYDPSGYDVKAFGIRKAMSLAKKGDIFVRRYRNYLDGYFIPGRFSHSGLYVGNGIIVHAMSDGVQKIDILDFLRCDGFAILRPVEKPGTSIDVLVGKAASIAKSYIGNKYDFDFKIEKESKKHSEAVYCHELVRKCYPDLDIPMIKPSLWNGMIRWGRETYLAQSFFDSPDIEVVYDSDYSDPICSTK